MLRPHAAGREMNSIAENIFRIIRQRNGNSFSPRTYLCCYEQILPGDKSFPYLFVDGSANLTFVPVPVSGIDVTVTDVDCLFDGLDSFLASGLNTVDTGE